MCACRCGIRVHLRDGKVRYIDGNLQHAIETGVICAKGAWGACAGSARKTPRSPRSSRGGTKGRHSPGSSHASSGHSAT